MSKRRISPARVNAREHGWRHWMRIDESFLATYQTFELVQGKPVKITNYERSQSNMWQKCYVTLESRGCGSAFRPKITATLRTFESRDVTTWQFHIKLAYWIDNIKIYVLFLILSLYMATLGNQQLEDQETMATVIPQLLDGKWSDLDGSTTVGFGFSNSIRRHFHLVDSSNDGACAWQIRPVLHLLFKNLPVHSILYLTTPGLASVMLQCLPIGASIWRANQNLETPSIRSIFGKLVYSCISSCIFFLL